MREPSAKNFAADFRHMVARAERNTFGMDRQWLLFETAQVYMRISPRHITGVLTPVIQIANIDVGEGHERKGCFTRLVTAIRDIDGRMLFIENVLERAFADALVRRGWRIVRDIDFQIDLVLDPV